MTSPGTRLGRYEIRSRIGAGGMGEVFLAWDRDLEREVAVKVLRTSEGGDRVRRFLQEAKAASALSHPNVAHVYEIGSGDDVQFIAMELVPGETLRKRIARGPMPAEEALSIAMQIAGALGAAHGAGIVHRDVKPENVIVGNDGHVKVLDFGLAKLHAPRGNDAATVLKTATGVAMGTFGYMAPEQMRDSDVTAAADVYSFGVVLYELLTGKRPVDVTPVDPCDSKGLNAIVRKSLAADPRARYQNANELLDALRSVSAVKPRSKRPIAIAATVLLAIVLGAGVPWMYVRHNRKAEAVRQVELAQRMLSERKMAEANEAAMLAAKEMPADPRVVDTIARTTTTATFESDPPGATVSLQRIGGPETRVRMGVTPLSLPRLVTADYMLTLEKSGFEPVTRPVSALPAFVGPEMFARSLSVRMKLAPAGRVPPGMVFVEGGPYRLGGFQRPSDRLVSLSDFFIDRLEVSNREFEEFVRAGGYRRRELWKTPFVDGGRTVPFDEAMARFHDTTGLPGPRSWSNGVPPTGRENHPVTDVTWYEAAAFAEWKGKRLPTVHQWEKAARPPLEASVGQSFPWGFVSAGMNVIERANFVGQGTMPVDSMPYGSSPYGAHHMAGNVSEWCRNPNPPGYAARGGSWSDNVYTFGRTAALPGFYAAPTLGFRCASGGAGDEGDFALNPKASVPAYRAVDDRTFEEFRRRYDYDRRQPLNATVVERVETPDWTRETIAFQWNGTRVPAYLYLPKAFKRPLQVVYFAPAGDVTTGLRTLPQSIEVQHAALIRTGRAFFAVELEGYLGRPRPAGWVRPEPSTEEYVDYLVGRVTELRRGLDYLETRTDLDKTRIALFGVSAGGGTGVYLSALEPRFRSVAFAGTGIHSFELQYAPAASRINFIPRIRAPKLLLQGRYDEDTSLVSDTEPMFRLMTEPKRLVVFEGVHIAPAAIQVPAITKWWDETMGRVGE